MLSVSQAKSRCFEQDVSIVGAHLAVLDCFLDEVGEDLAESGGERNDLLLRELDDSEERAHSVEVLVIVEELTDVLKKLPKNLLTHVGLIEDSLAGVVLLFADQ